MFRRYRSLRSAIALLIAGGCPLAIENALAQDPDQAQVPVHWPTRGWRPSTPAALGLDPAPLEALLAAVADGDYGNVDRVFVADRAGRRIVDRRYPRDYRAITRGRKSYIGHGEGAEPDPGILPEFNYYDPDTHPYYRGRDLHTLQSVTKSVGAQRCSRTVVDRSGTTRGLIISRSSAAGPGPGVRAGSPLRGSRSARAP